jgi:phosphodiesterase/alkaline phosphatase D-like protein
VFDAANGRALIGVWGNRALDVQVRYAREANAVTQGIRSDSVRLQKARDFAGVIEIDRAMPGTIFYALYDGDEAISDVQSFRMPPGSRQTGDVAIGFSGDMEERYKPFRIFDAISAQSIDAFVHLGDTVYADIPRRDFTPTVSHYRTKHSNNRSDRSLQSFMAKHAMIATWDDHEIENDCNGEHPAMAVAEQVFREYWPARNSGELGLYRRLSFGRDIELFVLDTRRFRSPQDRVDGASKTMLGSAQKAQFIRDYVASNARYRLIATSVPFHGSSRDAWGSYATERDELLAMFAAAHAASGVRTVCLSADYHFAREWPRNEKRGVYEFMAGPLATFLTLERDASARERHSRGTHFVYGERPNFGVLRYDDGMRVLRVSYYNDVGARLHTREL